MKFYCVDLIYHYLSTKCTLAFFSGMGAQRFIDAAPADKTVEKILGDFYEKNMDYNENEYFVAGETISVIIDDPYSAIRKRIAVTYQVLDSGLFVLKGSIIDIGEHSSFDVEVLYPKNVGKILLHPYKYKKNVYEVIL